MPIKRKQKHKIKEVVKNPGWLVASFFLALLFIISAVYFYKFGNYIFFFQENRSLFLFTIDYFQDFAIKPGGLIEYSGNFLKQGYFSPIYGALVLSSVFFLFTVIFIKINQKLSDGKSFSLPVVFLPACILLLMQVNYNHMIQHNLGFLLVAAYFLISISSENKWFRWIFIALFPLFFYVVGAYAWIYIGMFALYSFLYCKGYLRYIYPSFLLVLASASFFLFKEILFLQPAGQLLSYPLPIEEQVIRITFLFLLSGVIVLFPLLVKLSLRLKQKNNYTRIISVGIAIVVFSINIFQITKLHNSKAANLFQLEKYVYRQHWDAVIEHNKMFPLENLLGQFYFNLALCETGQMCENLFSGRQDFGEKALILPWELNPDITNRLMYFYYAIGLVNEAHRLAYESMVINGYQPENLKMLVKTNLINGHYKITEKYINILKKTWHYRHWTEKYEAMLYNHLLVKSDPELGAKELLLPKTDFFIESIKPELNLFHMMREKTGNKKVFEYFIAWALLKKDIMSVVNEIKSMNGMGYTHIPRHIEEAALVYRNINGELPDLGGLTIRPETEFLYKQYVNAFIQYRGNMKQAESTMYPTWGKTFWYYLHFK
jgi:hypothetical protein